MELNVQEFLDDLPHLDSNSDYWLFRANGGDYYTDFTLNNYIGISWNNITLTDINNSNNLIEKLKQTIISKNPDILKQDSANNDAEEDAQPSSGNADADSTNGHNKEKLTQRQLSSLAGQLLRFANDVNINDLVLVPSESSEQFIVGRVISKPYTETKEVIEAQEQSKANYKHSGFMKRIKVDWLGRFNRADADTALYKMIYSQHTLSNINDYKTFINRALFDAYILDGDEIHLTYHVTQEKNIDAKLLGQFIYQYSKLYELLSDSSDLKIKVNIQSKGPAESTAKRMLAGGSVFLLLFLGGTAAYSGGNISVGNGKIEISANGLAEQNLKNQETNAKIKQTNDLNLLDREKKAYDLAKELQVPISSLGIEMPHKAEEALQKQLDKDSAYNDASNRTSDEKKSPSVEDGENTTKDK